MVFMRMWSSGSIVRGLKKYIPLRSGLRNAGGLLRITAVRHNDPESIDNIRGALHYLAKEEQKDGLCAYGCNEVPERPAAGRPRKPHF